MLSEPGRHLSLLRLFVKIGLMRQMAYRPHFFLMITCKAILMGLLFFFFQAIFLKVHRIGQCSYDQVFLLFSTFHIVHYLMYITFQRDLAFSLPRMIQTGDLDSRVIPGSTRQVSYRLSETSHINGRG